VSKIVTRSHGNGSTITPDGLPRLLPQWSIGTSGSLCIQAQRCDS
jgi:hypothetical protein